MNVAKANSQIFQALYIDTDAKSNKDKIVLIEETCESLPSAQAILNTMLKEPYYGVVIAGTNIAVMKFRSKLIDADMETGLGSKDISDILTEVANLAYDNKCEIPYYKGPIQYGDLPQMTVALDLKSLFDLGKVKDFGKSFMDNLIGVNKELQKKVEKIDLKEYAKLKDYVKNNENKYVEIEKLLKDNDNKTKDLDNFLKNITVYDVSNYLGQNFDNLSYYLIDLKTFKQNIPAMKDEVDKTFTVEEIEKNKEDDFNPDNNFKPKSTDPRDILKAVITTMNTTSGKKMDPSNLVDIGMSDKQKLLVAVKKPVGFNLPYWPKSPISSPTLSLIEEFQFTKQKKITK